MIRTVTAAALAAVVLTGCGAAESDHDYYGHGLHETSLRLSDGREVTCVVFQNGYPGGLSCDWNSAK